MFQFFRINGKPFEVKATDKLLVEITCDNYATEAAVEYHGNNTATVTFTVHRAGLYIINVLFSGRHIRDSPFYHEFLPGDSNTQKPKSTYYVTSCKDDLTIKSVHNI